MQIHYLHKNVYKLSGYSLSQEKLEHYRQRYEKPVKAWDKLKREGNSDVIAQEFSGISRASYFRYKARLRDLAEGTLPPTRRPRSLRKPQWGEAEKQLVLRLRRENPTYGKDKIAIILRRDHNLTLSESTVGRIIKRLMTKGLIQKSLSAPRPRRLRSFKSYAQPWRYGMKGQKLGEMIQVDHMTVGKNQITGKHFQAWAPVGRFIHANIYSNASSTTAKRFLKELIQAASFKIHSIQVDGGSEFMRDFEDACQKEGIALFVLPPRRPQYNGGVERGNRTFREEFYAKKDLLADSIGALRAELKKALHKYNTYRPHKALNGLTPIDYIHNILKAEA
jgi:putative transposase